MNDGMAQGSVSVNVPQFSVPPVQGVAQVSVMSPSSAGAEASISHPHEKRRTISLPDVCRNVFITYSLDVSTEIVPFVDFLTKQGFRAAVDLYDNPIRRMDINKWKDSYLEDPSNLIIIVISPKYKADIEGSVVDSHGLHTKYIHSMMQNEFIQQGSLNFRFIPVLFLSASQKHVPSWLQNTRVYRWPQDTEDLILRLLREERYVPPPVPMELTLIIRPVAPSSATTL
ncbi:adapter protein CIKS-like [Morone saxatilis]|uniref:adapter protein CIKS-like n=1 Tax=Morone saxatilis TaxID=34816 RepID=UPI0015E2081C|nr:adapter protein CIKS-like [Morone saxatilis]